MKKIALLIACAVLCVSPSLVLAWNAAGHMAIASIAYDELDPKQAAALVALLKEHPRFKDDFAAMMPAGLPPEAVDRWIFMHAATWPDIARGLPNDQKSIYNHPTWHYIDLPVFIDRQASQKIHPPQLDSDPAKAATLESMNAVQAITYSIAQLNSPAVSRPQKAVALCWVLHLIGDLHQPLHCAALYSAGRFREIPLGDRGGNGEHIHETGGVTDPNGRIPTLHWLWDSMLGSDDSYDAALGLARSIRKENTKESFGEALNLPLPAQWAQEGNAVAQTAVYTHEVLDAVANGEAHPLANLPTIEISDQYVAAARPVARQRAALAAYRLAQTLGNVTLTGRGAR